MSRLPDEEITTRQIDVDVVIITWNDGPLLEIAVTSALESVGVDVNVQIVDNGSDPPVILGPDSRVTMTRSSLNLGVAGGRNLGTAMGDADLVCFLDSDARLGPDCLVRLAESLMAMPDAALASPVFTGQRPEASAGTSPGYLRKLCRVLGLTSYYRPTAGQNSLSPGGTAEVEFSIGACQLFRRNAFEEVGGLDESIFYGPEDLDFCMKLRDRGWRVLQVSNAECHHPPRRRHRGLLSKQTMQHGWSVFKHLRRSKKATPK